MPPRKNKNWEKAQSSSDKEPTLKIHKESEVAVLPWIDFKIATANMDGECKVIYTSHELTIKLKIEDASDRRKQMVNLIDLIHAQSIKAIYTTEYVTIGLSRVNDEGGKTKLL